ncbi:hypothetical protein H8D36_07065 [archaeon]|nr:hypothetical protein [archaeon]
MIFCFPVLIMIPFITKKRKLKRDLSILILATILFVLLSFVIESNLASIGNSMNVNIHPDLCINCVCGDLECRYSENDVHIDSNNIVSSLLIAGNYLLLSGPILFIGILFLFFRKPDNSITLFFKWLLILYIIRIFVSRFASSLLYGDWSFALMYNPILSIMVGYYILKSKNLNHLFLPILIITFIFFFKWILF